MKFQGEKKHLEFLDFFFFFYLVCWMLSNCLNFNHTDIVCPFGWVRRGGPQLTTPAGPHKDNPVDLSPLLSLFMSRLMMCLFQSVVHGVTITVGDMAPFTNFWPNLFLPQQWTKPERLLEIP